jgi:putative CocE/NonD family hydrolase
VPALAEHPRAWTARPATYKVVTQRDVRIVMDDGIRLDADIYRPATADGKPAPGRFPVIVTQVPYNKVQPEVPSQFLVQRGYIQLIVDVRGTGGSEGSWQYLGPQEQRDGKTLVEWAAAQPWSTGSVALLGTSYSGIIQLLTAEQQPKGLKAIFPVVPATDLYRDLDSAGGSMGEFLPFWLAEVPGSSAIPPTSVVKDPAGAALETTAHVTGVTGLPAQTVLETMQGGATAYDGDFYTSRSPITHIDKVRVPTFIVGGSYDLFQRGEPINYNAIRANGVPTKLLIGPWTHLAAGNGLPQDGVPDLDHLELRWFDHYVRGIADPTLDRDIAAVTYADTGTGHYLRAPSWPPPGVSYSALKLPIGPPDSAPYVPVAGLCSRSTLQWFGGSQPYPCETDAAINDNLGLTYDFPVHQKLTLAGSFAAHLYVSTTGRDGQLAVRVEDLSPSGTARQLTAGWQVLSMRALDSSRTARTDGLVTRPYHDFTESSQLPVTPGGVMDVWVEIFDAAATIPAGDSLRLSIQTADTPHTVPTLPQLQGELGSTLTVLHDAQHPSELVIPIQSER